MQAYSEVWELIGPACGDDDYASKPTEIQVIRGPYPSQDAAWVALRVHIGLENDAIRAARGL